MKALIAGAGITGTAAAITLARRGIDTTVVERSETGRALGSGISMVGPALRALDRLNLLDACLDSGCAIRDITIFDMQGELRHRIPLPALVPRAPGLLGMMRPKLQRILLEAAHEAGVEFRFGVELQALRCAEGVVEARGCDGTAGRFDMVIGADGLRSTVRTILFGEVEPVFRKQGVFRAVVPRPREVTGVCQFHGHPSVHPGFTPTGQATMYVYCAVSAEDATRPSQAALPELMRSHLAPFGGLVAQVREHIRDPDSVDYRPLETLMVSQPWARGRVLVLGDAAHATTPQLAAGAALCLEDAVALGEELDKSLPIPDTFQRFSGRRESRCRFTVESSLRLSRWQAGLEEPTEEPARFIERANQVLAGPY